MKKYPRFILYDFVAVFNKEGAEARSSKLTIESEQVPISVSVDDTLEKEPTHIVDKEPEELIRRFMKGLERRARNIRKKVREEFVPNYIVLQPKVVARNINQWCDQLPVIWFNSGKYDLNLKKKHFAGHLANTAKKNHSGQKRKRNNVFANQSLPFFKHNQLLGPRCKLRQMGKSVRMSFGKILFTV